VAAVSETRRHPLSDDDVTVVVLICEGLTNSEVAARMEIGEHVVSLHISRILHRLGLRNRVQLAVWAIKQGVY
jgi:DNA-binding NarL/FixJ family response regulator